MSLPIGLYDQLVTEELAARLNMMGDAAQTDELASGQAAGPRPDLLSKTLALSLTPMTPTTKKKGENRWGKVTVEKRSHK